MPKISVVMPVYNTKEEFLHASIKSILNQTYSDFEFIIINDGSTNNAKEVILSYPDSRIKYFEQENHGLIYTLNKGISLSQGEYIARMDSDDISLPERFAKQVNVLDKNSDIGAVGSYIKLFPTPDFEVKYAITPTYLDLLRENQLAHPVVMFRKSVLEQFNLKYNNCLYAEDYELWSRLIKVSKIYNIPEVLLKYRRHDNTISAIHSDLQSQNTQKTKQNMLDFLTHDKKLQHKICQLLAPKYIYKLFGFIPILKIKRKSDCDKWYLFCLIKFKTTKKV